MPNDDGNKMRGLHQKIDRELELARAGEELAIREASDFVAYEAALHSLHGAVIEMEADDADDAEETTPEQT